MKHFVSALGTLPALDVDELTYPARSYRCGICSRSFASKAAKKAHKRDKHGQRTVEQGFDDMHARGAAKHLASLPAAYLAQLQREWEGPSYTYEMTPERRAELMREWDDNTTDGGC